MKRKIAMLLAAIMTASMLSGCVVKAKDGYLPGAGYDTSNKKPSVLVPEVPATTTKKPVVVVPETTTTKKPVVVVPETTTTKKPVATAAPKPAAPTASQISRQLTEALSGEKLTNAKEYLIGCGIREAKISMFTDSGETLDGTFNAPSTYDLTKVVYSANGSIALYGKKVRFVPDALKDFIKDAAREAALQKVVDSILN